MTGQDFAASGRAAGGKKAPKTGRMTPAQLLVKGEMTHVQSSTTGGEGRFSLEGISLGANKDSAEVNITMYVVDSETGEVLDSEMTTFATAKAYKMKEKVTYLTPLSGADKIKEGMSVFPAEE